MSSADRLWLSDRQVDLVTGDVVRAGEAEARLTTKERELLAYLVGRQGRDVPRADLLTDVWGYSPTARTRAVDFTVRRLRQKIESDPKSPVHVCTVHGTGYRFDPGESAEPSEPVPQITPSLPLASVTPSGPEPDEVAVVLRAFTHGARLVSLIGLAVEALEDAGRHVASTFGPRVLWLSGSLAALSTVASAAGRPAARRLLLRQDTPELVVIAAMDTADDDAANELADTLRSVPALRVLVLAQRRLGLAAEHALRLTPAASESEDLTALDAAWATLSDPLREAWIRLAACTGTVDILGAESLLGPQAIDQLQGLKDIGVLKARDGAGGMRFALREAACRYGRQRMGGALSSVRQKYRMYLLERYSGLVSRLSVEVPPTLLEDAEELAALWNDDQASQGDRLRAALLLGACGGSAEEERVRLESVPPDEVPDDLALPLHLLRARLRLATGAASASLSDARDALRCARQRDHALGEGLAATLMASALMRTGRLLEAAEAARHARARFRDAGHRQAEVAVLQVLGRVEHELGQIDEAEETLRDAVHLARLSEATVPLAQCLVALGTLQRHRKRLPACEDAYEEAGRLLEGRSGVEVGLVRERLHLEAATLDLERGAVQRALSVLLPLAEQLQRDGRTRDAGEAWLAIAGTRWQAGDLVGAIEGFERGRTAFELSEDRLYTGLSLAWSGATAAAAGELELAGAWIEEARAHLEPLGLRRGRDVLSACRAHVDRARGRSVAPSITWREEVEQSSRTWGDVRLALRLLDSEAP